MMMNSSARRALIFMRAPHGSVREMRTLRSASVAVKKLLLVAAVMNPEIRQRHHRALDARVDDRRGRVRHPFLRRLLHVLDLRREHALAAEAACHGTQVR